MILGIEEISCGVQVYRFGFVGKKNNLKPVIHNFDVLAFRIFEAIKLLRRCHNCYADLREITWQPFSKGTKTQSKS